MRRALLPHLPHAMFFEVGQVKIAVYAVFHCPRNRRAWWRPKDA
jgi:hypothetical protein